MSAVIIKCAITDQTIDLKRDSGNVSVTTAAGKIDSRIINATSGSEVEHTFSTAVGNAGYLYIKNMDATNYVDIGFATGVYPHRYKAGQVGLFPITPAQSSIFLLANTATCEVEITLHEA